MRPGPGQLGNPHGVLTADVDREDRTVEVGQPWRNERAGLTDDRLGVILCGRFIAYLA